MRPAFMAAEHFDADCAVGTPRAEHIAFYRRAFGATIWRQPRDYPGLTAKLACVGADYRLAQQFIELRYPFFKSDRAEREALFGPSGDGSRRGGLHEDAGGGLDQVAFELAHGSVLPRLLPPDPESPGDRFLALKAPKDGGLAVRRDLEARQSAYAAERGSRPERASQNRA